MGQRNNPIQFTLIGRQENALTLHGREKNARGLSTPQGLHFVKFLLRSR